MTWHIEVIAGLDRGKKATLKNGPVVVGRDQVRCNLVLSDESVSRIHAKVTVDASGTIFIEDLGSTHGTFINGRQIYESKAINMEDSITMGNCQLALGWAVSVEAEGERISQSPSLAVLEIGRDPSNHLVINDPKVSRTHARIECRTDGYYLIDTNSTYGTSLNGTRITGSVLMPIPSWISIEKYQYYFDGNKLVTELGVTAAVINASSVNPAEALRISDVLILPFRGSELVKWLVGCLLSVIPIVSLLVSGYQYKLYQKGMEGYLEMPAWEDWKNLFVNGFFFSLIRVIYFIPSATLLLVMTYVAAANVDFTTVTFILTILPGGLLSMMTALVLPMGWGRYAASGNFGDAFHFTEIITRIRSVSSHYMKAIAVIAVIFMLMFPIALIPYVGMIILIIGAFFISIVSGIIFGNLYGLSQQPDSKLN